MRETAISRGSTPLGAYAPSWIALTRRTAQPTCPSVRGSQGHCPHPPSALSAAARSLLDGNPRTISLFTAIATIICSAVLFVKQGKACGGRQAANGHVHKESKLWHNGEGPKEAPPKGKFTIFKY